MMERQEQLTPKPVDGKTRTFKFAYSFILADYFLRWVLYGLFRFQMIPGWAFWLGQVLVISLIVSVLAALRNANTKEKYNIPPENEISPEATFLSTILALGGVLLGTYIVGKNRFFNTCISSLRFLHIGRICFQRSENDQRG